MMFHYLKDLKLNITILPLKHISVLGSAVYEKNLNSGKKTLKQNPLSLSEIKKIYLIEIL